MKLFTTKCHEQATLWKLWCQMGNSSVTCNMLSTVAPDQSVQLKWPDVVTGISVHFSTCLTHLFCGIKQITYSAFQKTFDKRFPKFVWLSRILLQTWQFHYIVVSQSNHEFQNKVVNFTPNFVGNLRSLLTVKFASFGVVGLVIIAVPKWI